MGPNPVALVLPLVGSLVSWAVEWMALFLASWPLLSAALAACESLVPVMYSSSH